MAAQGHCLIAGAGINGMLTALELADAGLPVTILERREVGRESSWAGGGILSPLYPWRYPPAVSRLAAWGQRRYPEIAGRLAVKLRWDPAKGTFVNADRANRLLRRPMRLPWTL